jgi:hypothetical protein
MGRRLVLAGELVEGRAAEESRDKGGTSGNTQGLRKLSSPASSAPK